MTIKTVDGIEVRTAISSNKEFFKNICKEKVETILDLSEKYLKKRVVEYFQQDIFKDIWEKLQQPPSYDDVKGSIDGDWFELPSKYSLSKGGMGDFIQEAMFGFPSNSSKEADTAKTEDNLLKAIDDVVEKRFSRPEFKSKQDTSRRYDITIAEGTISLENESEADTKLFGAMYMTLSKINTLLLITYRKSLNKFRLNAGEIYAILKESFFEENNFKKYVRVDVVRNKSNFKITDKKDGVEIGEGTLYIKIQLKTGMIKALKTMIIYRVREIYRYTRPLWNEDESTIKTFFQWFGNNKPE
jgi:hypothetical protein